MYTEGPLNVCHVWMFTGEKYLGVIKLQVICGGHCVSCCRNLSLFLSISLANHLSIFLSIPVML